MLPSVQKVEQHAHQSKKKEKKKIEEELTRAKKTNPVLGKTPLAKEIFITWYYPIDRSRDAFSP